MRQRNHSAVEFPTLNTVIIAGIILGAISLLLTTTFRSLTPASLWSDYVFYAVEIIVYLGAALLCWRNWQYSQLVSARSIWFWFGVGCFSYTLGVFFFAYWELILEREPDVSLGDPFFIGTTLFWLVGMLVAVQFRGISLDGGQGIILACVSLISIWLGWLVANPSEATAAPRLFSEREFPRPGFLLSQMAQAAPTSQTEQTPQWVIAVENALTPLVGLINLSYVAGDILLLVMATAIVLTFWGGRFSTTWTFVASGFFFFYLADMVYAFVVINGSYDAVNFGFLDSLWTLTGILLAIGAAKEYDLSFRRLRR
ncbi:MAG: hypothetical protein ACFB4I_18300 [Cyanophyceae cyanobacterium]